MLGDGHEGPEPDPNSFLAPEGRYSLASDSIPPFVLLPGAAIPPGYSGAHFSTASVKYPAPKAPKARGKERDWEKARDRAAKEREKEERGREKREEKERKDREKRAKSRDKARQKSSRASPPPPASQSQPTEDDNASDGRDTSDRSTAGEGVTNGGAGGTQRPPSTPHIDIPPGGFPAGGGGAGGGAGFSFSTAATSPSTTAAAAISPRQHPGSPDAIGTPTPTGANAHRPFFSTALPMSPTRPVRSFSFSLASPISSTATAASSSSASSSRPKSNARTTSSTFVNRITTADHLAKALVARTDEDVFVFVGHGRSFYWLDGLCGSRRRHHTGGQGGGEGRPSEEGKGGEGEGEGAKMEDKGKEREKDVSSADKSSSSSLNNPSSAPTTTTSVAIAGPTGGSLVSSTTPTPIAAAAAAAASTSIASSSAISSAPATLRKDPQSLAKVTFAAFPTCHDVNQATKSYERLDVIIGFSTGDLVWFDPMCLKYARFNKGGCITSSPCVSVRWLPGSENVFLVAHQDGTMFMYDKDRDDPDPGKFKFVPRDTTWTTTVTVPTHVTSSVGGSGGGGVGGGGGDDTYVAVALDAPRMATQPSNQSSSSSSTSSAADLGLASTMLPPASAPAPAPPPALSLASHPPPDRGSLGDPRQGTAPGTLASSLAGLAISVRGGTKASAGMERSASAGASGSGSGDAIAPASSEGAFVPPAASSSIVPTAASSSIAPTTTPPPVTTPRSPRLMPLPGRKTSNFSINSATSSDGGSGSGGGAASASAPGGVAGGHLVVSEEWDDLATILVTRPGGGPSWLDGTTAVGVGVGGGGSASLSSTDSSLPRSMSPPPSASAFSPTTAKFSSSKEAKEARAREGREAKEAAAANRCNPISHWRLSRRAITGFALGPDMQTVAVVGEDGKLRIVDVLREKLLDSFSSYFGGLTCVCWSPDGRYVLTGGQDDLISIFCPAERRLVARCQGHCSFVTGVAFDPWRHGQPRSDAQDDELTYRFGSVGEDCNLILWDFAPGALPPPPSSSSKASRSNGVSVPNSRRASPLHSNYHPPPSRAEVPTLEPVMVKYIDGDLLTSLEFRVDVIVTADRAGAIKTWKRPTPPDGAAGLGRVGSAAQDHWQPAEVDMQPEQEHERQDPKEQQEQQGKPNGVVREHESAAHDDDDGDADELSQPNARKIGVS